MKLAVAIAACAGLGCGDNGPAPVSADAMIPTPGSSWAAIAAVGEGPIQETGVAELGGAIYVVGGFDASVQIRTLVQRYDPDADAWSTVAPLPRAVHHANVAATGGKLYVAGAMVLDNFSFVAIPDTWEYDPDADQWTPRAPMPTGTERGGAAVAAVDGSIYVAGGLRGSAVAEASRYNPVADQWQALPPLPAPRDHLVGASVDGVFYAIGGRDTGITALTGATTAFDPDVGEWQPRAALPTPRGGTAAGVVAGEIIVVGGEGNTGASSGVFAEVEAYSPEQDRWRTLAPMKTPRHGMGAAGFDGKLYVPGGADRQAFAAVDLAEVLTP